MKKLCFVFVNVMVWALCITFLGCTCNRLLVPKELTDTEAAVKKARILEADLKCTDEYFKMLALWKETKESYKINRFDPEWIIKAQVVKGIADNLCPDLKKHAAAEMDQNVGTIDSDGDGVSDSIDKCPNTSKGLAVDSKGCPDDSDGDGVLDIFDQCSKTPKCANVNKMGCWVCDNINFDFNKWTINTQYFSNLDEIASCLKVSPSIRVDIHGHADIIGTYEHNQVLSDRRAKSVMEYLLKKGIPKERFTTRGFSFSRPIELNKTKEGRAKNRRVELKPVYILKP